jgi:hypothetical protein
MLLILGPERRSVEIDNKNKTITAYHESGHAIIAYYTKDAMPINKATIMPRGPTLGHVSFFFFIIYVLYLHFECYPESSPCPPLALLPYPLTPTSWPWHSPVLGHIKFARPRGLSSQ